MQRNIILFILLSAFILVGWFWLVNFTATPAKKNEPLAQGPTKTTKSTPEKLPEAKTTPEPKKTAEPKIEVKKEEKKSEEKKLPQEEPLETITLGGAGFHLSVGAITRGAGIRHVTLNRFKAADWRGRPAEPTRPLELIQDDPYAPSFRMYHYADAHDAVPVFGLGEKNWQLVKKDVDVIKDKDGNVLYHEVHFTSTVPGLEQIVVKKTYRLAPKDYHVTLLLTLHYQPTKDKAPKEIEFRYQLTGGLGLPIEGEWYTSTFRNSMIGLVDTRGSMWRKVEDSTRISMRQGGDEYPKDKIRGDSRLQYAGVVNQFFASLILVDNEQPTTANGGVDPAKILAWARPTHETSEKRGTILSMNDDEMVFLDAPSKERSPPQRYLLLPRTKRHIHDLDLQPNHKAVLSYYETPDGKKVASWIRPGETLRPQFDDITCRVNSEIVKLQPGDTAVHQFMLYHGPVKAALLGQFYGDEEVPDARVQQYTQTLYLRTLTDYPSDNPFGWVSSKIMLTDVIIFFTKLMHWLLNYLHFPFGYGLSIVVLTLMVRGMMFPISRRQALFSAKMQELAPEMKKIKERYKDDPQAQMQATWEFQKKNGINPLGSCWPLFLQMPIFFGLYFALQESIHFRLANFLWIENLAAPDMLLYWSESIPIISSPDHSAGFWSVFYLGPYLNILPIFAAIMMLVQQIQTMPPPADEQQEMQQKMMRYMSIFFGIMFYKVAAGMCIYFITSSLWGLAERKLLPKKKSATELAAVPAGAIAKGLPPQKGKFKPMKKEKEDETVVDKIKAWWKEVLKQAEKK